jgi:hypothetical protein
MPGSVLTTGSSISSMALTRVVARSLDFSIWVRGLRSGPRTHTWTTSKESYVRRHRGDQLDMPLADEVMERGWLATLLLLAIPRAEAAMLECGCLVGAKLGTTGWPGAGP